MPASSQAMSDPGRVRKNNEDCWFASDEVGLYALADGVGGFFGGEIASRIFIDTVGGAAERLAVLAPGEPDTLRGRFLQLVDAVFQEASERIYGTAQRNERTRLMATTGLVLAVLEGRAVVGHVGDSRAYLLRQGQVRQLTSDHTLAQELFDRGLLTPEEFAAFPHRNVLARAVGQLPQCRVDALWFDIQPGDRLLLCSDGLYRYFKPEEIGELCRQGAEAAVAAANTAGGLDNITAILVEVEEGSPTIEGLDTESQIRVLQDLFLFRQLTYQEVLRALKIVHQHRYPPGAAIVREGERGERLYVVVEGEVEIRKAGIPLATLRPGDHFGEIAFMDGRPRSASVTARTHVAVLSIRRDDFEALMRDDPVIATKLLWRFTVNLSERLRILSDDFVQVRR